MNSTTQFNGQSRGEVCDVIVGFDFGTSCSKVVLRTPFQAGGQAFAVTFGSAGHGTCKYLLPSILWIAGGGRVSLERAAGGVLLRDIKYHLMRGEPVPSVGPEQNGPPYASDVVAVAFLASALRVARSWFLTHQRALYGDYTLRWSFNLGLPSADFANKHLCDLYLKIAHASWRLSVGTEPIDLGVAASVLNAQEPEGGDVDDRDDAETSLIPEVAAEVAGYARSNLRHEGLHVLVDIGATTLDICSFVLHQRAGDDCYELLTADVPAFGASMLYRARVSAVRMAVDEHTERLWDQYDPVSAMSDELEAYAPDHDSVEKSIRHHDTEYLIRCKRRIWETLKDLKTTRDPRSERWRTHLPVFLSGGGSVMPFYKSLIEHVSGEIEKLYVPCQGMRRLALTRPEGFRADVGDEIYHRLAVAWGLSYQKTDIGNVSRPGDTDDIAPMDAYDWGGKVFISKDMV